MSETPNTPAPSSGIADPAPLGLAGFAMTTFILSFANANLINESGTVNVVLGLALFYGGIAQFLAGMWEYRRGNTFGATAFGSFGAFWLSFWAINHLEKGADYKSVGLYLFAWFLFTGYMTVAALRTNGAVLAVFALLTLTFLCLALGQWQHATGTTPAAFTRIGGWVGIVTALAAWYASFAAVTNETHKRQWFPTWPR